MFTAFWVLVGLGVWSALDDDPWYARIGKALAWPFGFGVILVDAWEELWRR